MKLWIRTPVALAALAAVVSFGACSDDDDVTGGNDEDPVDEATVEMQDNVFDPPDVLLSVGGTVTWVNAGDNDHTTTSDNDIWDSEGMDPGETFAQTFDTAGTFDYVCTFHDGMEGTIVVE